MRRRECPKWSDPIIVVWSGVDHRQRTVIVRCGKVARERVSVMERCSGLVVSLIGVHLIAGRGAGSLAYGAVVCSGPFLHEPYSDGRISAAKPP